MPVLISWMARTSAGTPEGSSSDDPLDVPGVVADDPPVRARVVELDRHHGGAGAGGGVGVKQRRDDLGVDQRVIAGEDDDRVGIADDVVRGAHGAACAVGLGLDDRLGAVREAGREVAIGETITATLPAPASRAASTGQATIGRPHTGCRTFGSDERIRVPSPAAMIRTVAPPQVKRRSPANRRPERYRPSRRRPAPDLRPGAHAVGQGR